MTELEKIQAKIDRLKNIQWFLHGMFIGFFLIGLASVIVILAYDAPEWVDRDKMTVEHNSKVYRLVEDSK